MRIEISSRSCVFRGRELRFGPDLARNIFFMKFITKSMMHNILVHAQDSCACTKILCMHKNLVHAQESCACTRVLCMHKLLVHAQDFCVCTRFLSVGFYELYTPTTLTSRMMTGSEYVSSEDRMTRLSSGSVRTGVWSTTCLSKAGRAKCVCDVW